MMTSPHFTTSPHFGDVPTFSWPEKNVGTSGDVPTFSKTWRRPHIFAPATSPHFRGIPPATDSPPSPPSSITRAVRVQDQSRTSVSSLLGRSPGTCLHNGPRGHGAYGLREASTGHGAPRGGKNKGLRGFSRATGKDYTSLVRKKRSKNVVKT